MTHCFLLQFQSIFNLALYDLKSDLLSCGIITFFWQFSETSIAPLWTKCVFFCCCFFSVRLKNQKICMDFVLFIFFFLYSMRYIISKLELQKAFFTETLEISACPGVYSVYLKFLRKSLKDAIYIKSTNPQFHKAPPLCQPVHRMSIIPPPWNTLQIHMLSVLIWVCLLPFVYWY